VYTFSGHFQGSQLSGSYREDVTYDDGTAFTCTTNATAWTASRDAQGTQTAALPAGSYSGRTPEQSVFSFYVSNDGTRLQDVTVPTYLGCAPTKSFYDHIGIATIPLAADGSFSATTTQLGVLFGATATFTYTFSGHVHGTDDAGTVRFAGTFRESIAYDDGIAHDCTTDNQAWHALRDAQGTQTLPAPPVGSYSGRTPEQSVFSFYVSNDGTRLQDVIVPTYLGCAPSKSFYDHIGISEIALAADGSFSASATQDGILAGHAATFTYRFSGHLHGTVTGGLIRVAVCRMADGRRPATAPGARAVSRPPRGSSISRGTPLGHRHSFRENCRIATPIRARPSSSTMPSSNTGGRCQPHQVTPGSSVRLAVSEMSRWSNTSRRIGSTA
jgi:hypothetical protein